MSSSDKRSHPPIHEIPKFKGSFVPEVVRVLYDT